MAFGCPDKIGLFKSFEIIFKSDVAAKVKYLALGIRYFLHNEKIHYRGGAFFGLSEGVARTSRKKDPCAALDAGGSFVLSKQSIAFENKNKSAIAPFAYNVCGGQGATIGYNNMSYPFDGNVFYNIEYFH